MVRPRADQGQADGRLGAANKNVKNEENEKNKDLSPNGLPPCPHKKISELYMKLLPEMPAIFSMSDKRKASLSAAWKSDERFQTVEFWEMTFNYVRTSDFLMGKTQRFNGATFDWIINRNNLLKTIEGNYENQH